MRNVREEKTRTRERQRDREREKREAIISRHRKERGEDATGYGRKEGTREKKRSCSNGLIMS